MGLGRVFLGLLNAQMFTESSAECLLDANQREKSLLVGRFSASSSGCIACRFHMAPIPGFEFIH